MILGYQFINSAGLPVGNVQPTPEEAEKEIRFGETGRIYSIEKTKHGQLFLRYRYSMGMFRKWTA